MIDRLSTARRVSLLALVLIALYRLQLVIVVMGFDTVIAGFVQGDGITIAISVTLLVNLLAIPFVLHGSVWGLFVGYLVLVINMVFSGPFLLEGLADPRRLAGWMGSLIILTGNILGLVFGVVAIIERLGRGLPTWLQKAQVQLLKGIGAATCGMILLGVILSFGSAPATELSQTPDAVIEVELKEMRFHPDRLELEKDRRTALFLINRDDFQHSFDIDSLDVHVPVPAQSSAVVFVHPTESGQVHFYCGVAGHEAAGMDGSLTVR